MDFLRLDTYYSDFFLIGCLCTGCTPKLYLYRCSLLSLVADRSMIAFFAICNPLAMQQRPGGTYLPLTSKKIFSAPVRVERATSETNLDIYLYVLDLLTFTLLMVFHYQFANYLNPGSMKIGDGGIFEVSVDQSAAGGMFFCIVYWRRY